MMMTLAGKWLGIFDFLVLVSLAAVADRVVKTESATPDELLIIWSLIGGVGGSVASLHFYQPRSWASAITQAIVNVSVAGIFSPIFIDGAAMRLGIPVGLKLVLPMSFIVGFFACQAISRGLPYIDRIWRGWLYSWIKIIGEEQEPYERKSSDKSGDRGVQ